jgi:hypothetical protein
MNTPSAIKNDLLAHNAYALGKNVMAIEIHCQ